MPNTDRFAVNHGYDNFFLESEIENQLLTKFDLANFFQVDNNLVGRPGMKVVINVYTATNGTEKLKVTEGNTKAISVSMTPKEKEITLAQNSFVWYDEEMLTDPNIVITGTRHMATDMFNTMNEDVIAELGDDLVPSVTVAGTDYFSAFVDAQALLKVETTDAGAPATFAFICPADLAAVRKALKDDLKYNESFARTGYVGTVAGTNLYVTNAIKEAGTIYFATAEALTLYVKSGTEVEQERDANVRKNTAYSRKYYVAALTDSTKAVKITKA